VKAAFGAQVPRSRRGRGEGRRHLKRRKWIGRLSQVCEGFGFTAPVSALPWTQTNAIAVAFITSTQIIRWNTVGNSLLRSVTR
jgi:hypothetical protein